MVNEFPAPGISGGSEYMEAWSKNEFPEVELGVQGRNFCTVQISMHATLALHPGADTCELTGARTIMYKGHGCNKQLTDS